MAQSLKNRFNGNGAEVVEYAGRFGIQAACNKFGTTYLPMRGFLIDKTKDENYGVLPKFTKLYPKPGQTVLDAFVDAFRGYVITTEDLFRQKDDRIARLEAKLAYYEGGEVNRVEDGLASLIDTCQLRASCTR